MKEEQRDGNSLPTPPQDKPPGQLDLQYPRCVEYGKTFEPDPADKILMGMRSLKKRHAFESGLAAASAADASRNLARLRDVGFPGLALLLGPAFNMMGNCFIDGMRLLGVEFGGGLYGGAMALRQDLQSFADGASSDEDSHFDSWEAIIPTVSCASYRGRHIQKHD